jgi:hypothetical protein
MQQAARENTVPSPPSPSSVMSNASNGSPSPASEEEIAATVGIVDENNDVNSQGNEISAVGNEINPESDEMLIDGNELIASSNEIDTVRNEIVHESAEGDAAGTDTVAESNAESNAERTDIVAESEDTVPDSERIPADPIATVHGGDDENMDEMELDAPVPAPFVVPVMPAEGALTPASGHMPARAAPAVPDQTPDTVRSSATRVSHRRSVVWDHGSERQEGDKKIWSCNHCKYSPSRNM